MTTRDAVLGAVVFEFGLKCFFCSK